MELYGDSVWRSVKWKIIFNLEVVVLDERDFAIYVWIEIVLVVNKWEIMFKLIPCFDNLIF